MPTKTLKDVALILAFSLTAIASSAWSASTCDQFFHENTNSSVLRMLRDYQPKSTPSPSRLISIDQDLANQLEQWFIRNPVISPHLSYQFKNTPKNGKVLAPIVALHLKALREGINKDSIKNIYVELGEQFVMALAIKSSSGDWYVFDPHLQGKRDNLQTWYNDLTALPGVDKTKIKISFTEVGGLLGGTAKYNKTLLFGPQMVEYTVAILAHLKNENLFKEKNQSLLQTLPALPIRKGSRLASQNDTSLLFEWISNHPIISYKNMSPETRDNYCHLRAMAVHLKALEMGIEKENIKKLWVYGHFEYGKKDGFWGFHVATAVRQQDGAWIVHDPYYKNSMSVDEWYTNMKAMDPYDLMQMISTDPAVMTPYVRENYSLVDLINSHVFDSTTVRITLQFLRSFFQENNLATGQPASANLTTGYPLVQSKDLLQKLNKIF